MPAAERLSRIAMIPTAPALYVQGRRLRRDTPILPPAREPWAGDVDGENPLRLLVFGDSTAAGVGAESHENALAGNLARELSARWNRGVHWTAVGESGATTRDLIERYLDEAAEQQYDFIFLTVGANDALGIRSRQAFGTDLRTILDRFRATSPHATILMSSLPAFHRFELLPQPLKGNLYLHSSSLESQARSIIASYEGAIMSPKPPPYTEGFFASDLFHPSEQGYREWAEFAIDHAFESGQLV